MNAFEKAVRNVKQSLGLSSASWLVRAARPAYDSVLSACYGRRGLTRLINGQESICIRPAHRYAHENYEPAVFAHLRQVVKPGSVILDVGAHVGLFTVLLARWCGPAGHVYAFEPAPQTRAALVDHLALNGVASRVTPVALAVSDAPGTARLYTVSNSPENTLSQAHTRIPGARPVEVPVTTIDAFCETRRIAPALLKIDIEGFELHALRGARAALARHRPAVVVEMHPQNWPEIGAGPAQAAALLADLGYRAAPLEEQIDPLAEYGHVVLEPVS